jgi:hypothetical protein
MRTRVKSARAEHGQATVETLLLVTILVAFITAIYQVFLVNHAIFRMLAIAHVRLFRDAFETNCYAPTRNCTYGSDPHARVIWRDLPEVYIPVLPVFERAGVPGDLRVTSNSPMHADTFKRTKAGSGAYLPPWEALAFAASAFPCGCELDEALWESHLETLLTEMNDAGAAPPGAP